MIHPGKDTTIICERDDDVNFAYFDFYSPANGLPKVYKPALPILKKNGSFNTN